MKIDLSPDAMQFITGLVESGEYKSAEDVVADGVRLLMSRQQLRGDIQQGIDQLDAGKGVDGKQVFAGLSRQVQIGIEQADRGEMIDHDTLFGQLKAMAADAQSNGDE